MRIGVAAGVRVGNRHATDRRTRALDHLSIVGAVEQRVLHITITVRPAIDRDRRDVARARKAAGAQHAVELVADARLEIAECRLHEALLPDAKLLARGEAAVGGTRNM